MYRCVAVGSQGPLRNLWACKDLPGAYAGTCGKAGQVCNFALGRLIWMRDRQKNHYDCILSPSDSLLASYMSSGATRVMRKCQRLWDLTEMSHRIVADDGLIDLTWEHRRRQTNVHYRGEHIVAWARNFHGERATSER